MSVYSHIGNPEINPVINETMIQFILESESVSHFVVSNSLWPHKL